ncbi:MAG: cohesin domain-containing protein [Candidatus Nealsonbacteria bacterium]
MKKFFLTFCIISLLLATTPDVKAAGASLSVLPQTGTFTVGSTFDVSVFLNTSQNNINVVKADLKFDPGKLQVIAPTKGISTVGEWIFPPSFSNATGQITFQGGFLEKGINSSQALISVITFRVISSGQTELNFLDSSQVLMADDQGTSILTSVNRGLYSLILPPPQGPNIFSETHPDQNKWYKNANPAFSWIAPAGAEGYSYSLNDDPLGEPDNTIDIQRNSVPFEDVPEGIQYFHLKAKANSSWGGTSHFQIMIDKNSPAEFKPYFQTFSFAASDRWLIYFSTEDLLSGLDYYQVKIVDQSNSENALQSGWIQTESPYSLNKSRSGSFEITIRAFDRAGNFREGLIKLRVLGSNVLLINNGVQLAGLFLSWWLVFISIALILLVVYSIYRRRKKKTDLFQIDLEKEIREAEKEIDDVKKAKEKLSRIRRIEERGRGEWQRLRESLAKIAKSPEDKNKNE